MEEILVAVDGSEPSGKIVDYACDLAKKMSAKIALMYVVQRAGTPEMLAEYATAERDRDAYARYLQSIGEEVMTRFGIRIKERGIDYESLLEIGSPAAQIVSRAAQRKSSIVVVGLRGLHGIDRMRALGSVSRRVLENSPCPVMVVPV